MVWGVAALNSGPPHGDLGPLAPSPLLSFYKKRSTRNYAPLLVEGPLQEKKRPSGRETITFDEPCWKLQAAQGGPRAA